MKRRSLTIGLMGMTPYDEALRIQEDLREQRTRGAIDDTLLLLEHPPVITIGRRGSQKNILASGAALAKENIRVFEVSRGGDVTYHGPGQLVGYCIVDLREHDGDIKRFIWKIQEVFIRLLSGLDIASSRNTGKYTGVWVGDDKITAIGIAVASMVTMHGFAFNVSTNLGHYRLITPCGIRDKGVTSLEKVTGEKQDFREVTNAVVGLFGEVFDVAPNVVSREELPYLGMNIH